MRGLLVGLVVLGDVVLRVKNEKRTQDAERENGREGDSPLAGRRGWVRSREPERRGGRFGSEGLGTTCLWVRKSEVSEEKAEG